MVDFHKTWYVKVLEVAQSELHNSKWQIQHRTKKFEKMLDIYSKYNILPRYIY